MEKGPPPRIERQTSNLPNKDAIPDLAHLPVAVAERRSHSVRYVYPAFCTLVGTASERRCDPKLRVTELICFP
jgi:hypothetical protein